MATSLDLRLSPKRTTDRIALVFGVLGVISIPVAIVNVVSAGKANNGFISGVIVAVLFIGLAAYLLRLGIDLTGRMLVMQRVVGTKQVDLGTVSRLQLKAVPSGQIYLFAWSDKKARIVLLSKTRSLPAEALKGIASAVQRAPAAGSGVLAQALRDQAKEVEKGVGPEQTTLSRLGALRLRKKPAPAGTPAALVDLFS